MIESERVNIRRAAAMACTSEHTIRNWIRAKKIRADISDQRKWLVDCESLKAYVEDGIILDADGTAWLESYSACRMFSLQPSMLARWGKQGLVRIDDNTNFGKRIYHRDSLAAQVIFFKFKKNSRSLQHDGL